MAIIVFSVRLEWLPSFGFESVGAAMPGSPAPPTSPTT